MSMAEMEKSFIAGFIAGEGCFTGTSRPCGTRQYVFQVGLSLPDEPILHRIKDCMGVGRISLHKQKNPDHQALVMYSVARRRDLATVIIPFMDRYLTLLPCHKSTQYSEWRAKFFAERPRRGWNAIGQQRLASTTFETM